VIRDHLPHAERESKKVSKTRTSKVKNDLRYGTCLIAKSHCTSDASAELATKPAEPGHRHNKCCQVENTRLSTQPAGSDDLPDGDRSQVKKCTC